MDHRIFVAAVVALVLIVFGGIYYVLGPTSSDVAPPVPTASAPSAVPAAPPAADRPAPSQPAANPPTGTSQAQSQFAPIPATPPTSAVTAANLEAEIARSDYGDLQALLKQHFPDEYNGLIDVAVRRRNEGASPEVAGEEIYARFQEMMRTKLKFAAAASIPVIDKLAQNEISLFHALGTEGPGFCLKVLGRDNTPATTPPPENIRKMMRLGTLYRFEAIVDGMPQFKPIQGLQPEEMSAFESGLASVGLKIEDVRTGAFLDQDGKDPGKACLMIEKLYTTVAGLPDETRRKLYAGMFFVGRD